jgi:hypothetical protein
MILLHRRSTAANTSYSLIILAHSRHTPLRLIATARLARLFHRQFKERSPDFDYHTQIYYFVFTGASTRHYTKIRHFSAHDDDSLYRPRAGLARHQYRLAAHAPLQPSPISRPKCRMPVIYYLWIAHAPILTTLTLRPRIAIHVLMMRR